MARASAQAGQSSPARRSRARSPGPESTLDTATAAKPTRGGANSQRRTVPAQPEWQPPEPSGLDGRAIADLPQQRDPGWEERGSLEENEVPGQLEVPKTGKPIPLATARFIIALLSIAILAFVVVAAFATLWQGQSIDNLSRLLEILFAPLVALVGVAVAFYYRSNPP